MKYIYIFFANILFLNPLFVEAQPNDASTALVEDSVKLKCYVSVIYISGLQKTKPYIVRRELGFKEGDSIANSKEVLLKARNRIFNTRLFTLAKVYWQNDTVFIVVKERWYTYPIPVLDIADRNFNEWWQVRNHDLGRLNYGIDFTQNNVRGRNETLKLYLQAGFNKKVEARYSIPYLDKAQKLGLSAGVSYIVDRQVGYATKNNYLMFTEIKDNARYRFSTSATLFHRNKLYRTQYLSFGYYHNQLPDTIARLNPSYFLDGKTTQQLISVSYSIVDDHRDIAYYPLKGYYWSASVSKIGITNAEDVNMWTSYLDAAWYKSLGHKWYSTISFSQKFSTPTLQPYIYGRALGYNAYYVSGYELYVIDGQYFSLAKANIRKRILSFEKALNFIPIAQFRNIPIQIYLRAYSDGGVAVDHTNNVGNARFANQFLWGNGIGIDFVSYYDSVFKIEYSVNRDREGGIYLHYKSMF